MYAYVGCRTTERRKARGKGIRVFRVSEDACHWEPIQLVEGFDNPSYLITNQAQTRLYVIHGDRSEVSAFSVDDHTGQLRFLNQVSTGGANPVHLALDPSERFLVISNHISSSLAVIPLDDDGALLARCQLVELSGQVGPHRVEQPFPKPHANPFMPDGRVAVPDKGLDCLFVYPFDAEQGRLISAEVEVVPAREGAGPRHIDFHPHRPWAYCLNELDSTVTVYQIADRRFDATQVVPSLSQTYTGNNRAAGIFMHPAGEHLFVSNRGEDSISGFAIDAKTGWLTHLTTFASGGKTPRFFTFDPQHRLCVANEDSDSIGVYALSMGDEVQPTLLTTVSTESPVCIAFKTDS